MSLYRSIFLDDDILPPFIEGMNFKVSLNGTLCTPYIDRSDTYRKTMKIGLIKNYKK
jgi:hypothetical protein